MKETILNLRRESFGGTLFAVNKGQRTYLDENEFNMLVSRTPSAQDFLATLGFEGELKIISPERISGNSFSAPDTIFFELTRACDLRCLHCFNNSGIKLPDELSPQERTAITEDVANSGVQEIRFTGGEPTLAPDIDKLMQLAIESGMRVSLGTNGIFANGPRAEKIANLLHLAVISLDGTRSAHDKIRGKGNFDRTLAGIRILQSYRVDVRVNTVVMKSNFDEVVALVEYLYDLGVAVFIRRLIPSGRADEMNSEMLTRSDYLRLASKLEKQLQDPRGLVRGHYLAETEVRTRIVLPFVRYNCSAGTRGLVILPNGRVQTCGFLGPLGEVSVGNLRKESLATVWQRLTESNHIEQLRSNLPAHNTRTSGPCTNCLAIALAQKEPENS